MILLEVKLAADGVIAALGRDHGGGCDIPVSCGRLQHAADARAQHGHPELPRWAHVVSHNGHPASPKIILFGHTLLGSSVQQLNRNQSHLRRIKSAQSALKHDYCIAADVARSLERDQDYSVIQHS